MINNMFSKQKSKQFSLNCVGQEARLQLRSSEVYHVRYLQEISYSMPKFNKMSQGESAEQSSAGQSSAEQSSAEQVTKNDGEIINKCDDDQKKEEKDCNQSGANQHQNEELHKLQFPDLKSLKSLRTTSADVSNVFSLRYRTKMGYNLKTSSLKRARSTFQQENLCKCKRQRSNQHLHQLHVVEM